MRFENTGKFAADIAAILDLFFHSLLEFGAERTKIASQIAELWNRFVSLKPLAVVFQRAVARSCFAPNFECLGELDVRIRAHKTKKRKFGHVVAGVICALLDGTHETLEQLGVNSEETVRLCDVNNVCNAGRVDGYGAQLRAVSDAMQQREEGDQSAERPGGRIQRDEPLPWDGCHSG